MSNFRPLAFVCCLATSLLLATSEPAFVAFQPASAQIHDTYDTQVVSSPASQLGQRTVQFDSVNRLTSLPAQNVFRNEIGADAANAAGANGDGVTVALIDTGVSNSPDLDGRIVQVRDVHGTTRDCVNLSNERSCNDSYGHGTFIAGLIAGNGTSSGGKYAGVAPHAKILSIKVAGRDGYTSPATIIAAINWVVSHRSDYGIDVLNLSLGVNGFGGYASDPLDIAAERAWRSGVTVVVAAGNAGPASGTISKPADDPLVISVGTVDDHQTASISDDTIAPFSSRGPTRVDGLAKPDVVAPGAHLISLRSHGSRVEQNFPGGVNATYRRGSGTSESAAVVSGAVALAIGANRGVLPDEVKTALVSTAQPVAGGDHNSAGAGIVDAAALVGDLSGTSQPPVTTLAQTAPTSRTGTNSPPGVIAITTGNSWYGNSWYGNSWYGNSWYGNSWYGNSWYGNSWYGNSWYGNSWYGNSWY